MYIYVYLLLSASRPLKPIQRLVVLLSKSNISTAGWTVWPKKARLMGSNTHATKNVIAFILLQRSVCHTVAKIVQLVSVLIHWTSHRSLLCDTVIATRGRALSASNCPSTSVYRFVSVAVADRRRLCWQTPQRVNECNRKATSPSGSSCGRRCAVAPVAFLTFLLGVFFFFVASSDLCRITAFLLQLAKNGCWHFACSYQRRT